MSSSGDKVADLRKFRPAQKVVTTWRALTTGTQAPDSTRRTLIAISGGADSSALAWSLAGSARNASEIIALAHVRHDMRPEAETLADRDLCESLAKELGLPFFEREIAVRSSGLKNLEASARKLRYAALAEMAREARCPFLAAGHQANDVLETLLMRLMRGAGPSALRGPAPRRRLARGVTLVRPMLDVTRAEAEAICGIAGWQWAWDATNFGHQQLRARVRHEVIPALEDVWPDAVARGSRTGRVLAQAGRAIHQHALDIFWQSDGQAPDEFRWKRALIRSTPISTVCEVLRIAYGRVCGANGADKVGSTGLTGVAEAARDDAVHPRRFVLGSMTVEVTSRFVTVRPTLKT